MAQAVGPHEALERWWGKIPTGTALDLGAGEGDNACWLAEHGFIVDAVEIDTRLTMLLARRCGNLPIRICSSSITLFDIAENAYSLIVASAILHFLRPTELWPLADRMHLGLIPGGFLIAEVFTTDDPGYAVLRDTDTKQIEPNTFWLDGQKGVIHYFAPDELRRVFHGLDVLEYEESRRIAADPAVGYTSGALLVARRKD